MSLIISCSSVSDISSLPATEARLATSRRFEFQGRTPRSARFLGRESTERRSRWAATNSSGGYWIKTINKTKAFSESLHWCLWYDISIRPYAPLGAMKNNNDDSEADSSLQKIFFRKIVSRLTCSFAPNCIVFVSEWKRRRQILSTNTTLTRLYK